MGFNVTLKQIAEELGMSAMTVSRALNNKNNVDKNTKKRVIEKARSMGYTPNHVAKSLVSRKTFTLGVIIPELSHVFFAQVISGIEEIAYQRDYQLILTNSAENYEREKKALQTLQSKRVDGILVSCSETTRDFSHFKSVMQSGIPFVFFDRCIVGIGASTISVNDRISAKKITLHLIEHGYERIACLHGPQVSIGKERLKGYREAMQESGVYPDKELIVESGFLERGGYNAMNTLLELPREKWPSAVVTVNDPVAIGAMQRIEEAGLRVPNDIAIAGFSDDIRSGLLKCPLTTVKQPTEKIGREAANKLIKTIQNNKELIEDIQLNTELKIRNSCGCG